MILAENIPDVTSLVWWVKEFGFPGVLVVMIWRAWTSIFPMIRDTLFPKCVEFCDRHFALMTVAEEQLKSGGVTLTKLANTQDEQGKMIEEIHSTVVTKKE